MFAIKHKLISIILLSILLALPFVALVPAAVYADHDGCSGGADSLERCIEGKKNAASAKCYDLYAGRDDALLQGCIQQVNSHYSSGGPRSSAPPLPSGVTPSPTIGNSSSNVVDNADCKVDPSQDLNEGNCRIIYWVNVLINVLSVLVGIVVTAMIILGGIRYSAAGAEPNAVAAAKKQIFGAIFALVAYGLMYALLQYLIPGGQF